MKIDYVEFNLVDLGVMKQFFSDVFGWGFNDYGLDYQEIVDGGILGGIVVGGLVLSLIILKIDDLFVVLVCVIVVGVQIIKLIFDFFGGKWFQFCELGGMEMVVWFECQICGGCVLQVGSCYLSVMLFVCSVRIIMLQMISVVLCGMFIQIRMIVVSVLLKVVVM